MLNKQEYEIRKEKYLGLITNPNTSPRLKQYAVNQFILWSEPVIKTYAWFYQNRGVSLSDLEAVARIAMYRALTLDFDKSKYTHINFLNQKMKTAMRDEIKNKGRMIKVSDYFLKKISKINKDINNLEQEIGCKLTDDEIIEKLNLNKETFELYKRWKNDKMIGYEKYKEYKELF